MENNNAIPVWYWIIAVLLLIWYILGIITLTGQVNLTEEALKMMTPAERQFYIDMPLWVIWAYALGVFGGFFGTIALLTKRRWAKYFLIASLIGVFAHIIYYLAAGGGLQVFRGIAIILPLAQIVIGAFAIWLSKFGIRKGWLR